MKLFHPFRAPADDLADKLGDQLKADLNPEMSDEEAFSFADFNAEAAERGGYSDYSYWGSTLRAFFQNKIAVFFLIIMVAVLAFTFIQPYLPNQKCPEAIVGMKLLHEDYGELTIIEVDNRVDKTIIRVVDSNGETSSKTWNILWAYNKIKIIPYIKNKKGQKSRTFVRRNSTKC